MQNQLCSHNTPISRRAVSIVLWLALGTGLAISIFTVVEEMCLATACRDTASFTFFGVGMGRFGIAYFISMLILLRMRTRSPLLEWALAAMVFAGVGSEFRLLWIQKYIIGGWCPLCISICCALFIAGITLLVEKVLATESLPGGKKSLAGWGAFALVMAAAGLAVAVVGVHALT